MPPSFDSIVLKMQRGIQHLKELHREIETFTTSAANGVINDFDSEPGYLLVKAFVRDDPPPQCSILIGEFLYQCRSTLDHLACELTVRNNQPVNSEVEFPIFDTRDKFRRGGTLTPAIQKRIGGIEPAKQAIIEREQPFQGLYGSPHNDPLWLLYALSNFDRHQALHLVTAYTDQCVIDLKPPEAMSQFVQVGTFYGPLKGETTIARFAILSHPGGADEVHVQANVRLDVAFAQAGPCAGRPVLYTLGDVGMRVGKLIEALTR